MKQWAGFAALLLLALAACAPLPAAATRPAAEQPAPRFVDLISPPRQHDPPFLDVPYTNFYCLRSFLDRETGDVAHQLYVADSYFGVERHWDAAHDASGRPLAFVLIGSNKITCEGGCAYADEFAAMLPQAELETAQGGLAVTFTAHSGDSLAIALSADDIAHQLAVVAAARQHLSATETSAAPAPKP